MEKQRRILREKLVYNWFFSFRTVVKYTPEKISIEATKIVSVTVSDFVKTANNTPIMGCKYINTATSVEDNLLKANALNRYVINVVQITT